MRLFSVFALVLTLLATPAWAAESTTPSKPVVKIGVTIPLTGDLAYAGEGVRNAVTMALQALPPDTKYAYQVVFEDDGLEAKRAASAANKMISTDKVDALISYSSGTGGVVSPIAEQNKILHFGIAIPSIADGDYNFMHATPPEEEARLMVAELKKRGLKKVAGIFMNQQGVLAMRDSFVQEIKGTDITLVTDKIVNPGEKDFRGILAKAKAQNPDVYLIISFTPQLEILAKQIKEAGITQPITSIEGFSLSNEPSLFEGLWYVDSATANSRFDAQYQARFGKPLNWGVANAYDAFNLIVYGYEHSNAAAKPATIDVAKTLYTVRDYDGVLGKLSIDDKGLVFSKATVKMIKDGKSVLAEPVAAEPAAPKQKN
jgi:branched-chain amino acid transport system substrate-binding protein